MTRGPERKRRKRAVASPGVADPADAEEMLRGLSGEHEAGIDAEQERRRAFAEEALTARDQAAAGVEPGGKWSAATDRAFTAAVAAIDRREAEASGALERERDLRQFDGVTELLWRLWNVQVPASQTKLFAKNYSRLSAEQRRRLSNDIYLKQSRAAWLSRVKAESAKRATDGLARLASTIRAYRAGDDLLPPPARLRKALASAGSAATSLLGVLHDPILFHYLDVAVARTMDPPTSGARDWPALQAMLPLIIAAVDAEEARLATLPQGRQSPKRIEPRPAPGQQGIDARLVCAVVIYEICIALPPHRRGPGVRNVAAHDACAAYWVVALGDTAPSVDWRPWLEAARRAAKSLQPLADRLRQVGRPDMPEAGSAEIERRLAEVEQDAVLAMAWRVRGAIALSSAL